MKALLLTIPHSGEKVPDETPWLKGLPESVLMRDVDRFVDQLYQPVIEELDLEVIKTPWHRYVIDLNRSIDEVDQASVETAVLPAGSHPRGLHWSVTTYSEMLMPQPISEQLHLRLIEKYFDSFHRAVTGQFEKFHKLGVKNIWHLDLHSMPSQGTKLHPDPGQTRANVVISDLNAASADPEIVQFVIEAFKNTGLNVAYNDPYVGGGITRRYGQPDQGHHTVQVELNRSLYMNEETKKMFSHKTQLLQNKLTQAIKMIYEQAPQIHVSN